MIRIVPNFPLTEPPEEWDVLSLWSGTVFLEAEGEPPEGQRAVSWVIRHLVDEQGKSPHEVILKPFQFSCWLPSYRPRAEARLSIAEGPSLVTCWCAAAGAFWRLSTDPVMGANHYLNVDATRRERKKHDLPMWAADPEDPTRIDAAKIVGVIGHHHFLRA